MKINIVAASTEDLETSLDILLSFCFMGTKERHFTYGNTDIELCLLNYEVLGNLLLMDTDSKLREGQFTIIVGTGVKNFGNSCGISVPHLSKEIIDHILSSR